MRTTRSTRAALVAIGSFACIGGALIALAGCPNTASTLIYTPPTGIQINSQALVTGLGCGSGPGQVYRYAAVVGEPEADGGVGIAKGTTPITSGVFDCFSDALFANLPQPDGGSVDFGIDIYAYDFASFPAALAGCENATLNASCLGEDGSVVEKEFGAKATWTTHCRDTESTGVPQFAYCPNPLAPPGAGAQGDAGDAGDAAGSGDASSEASDAPADVPAEVADAPTAEASDGPVVSGEGGDAPLE